MSEKYFTTKQNRNNIVKIFKCTPIVVNYHEYETQEQRQFNVCVEKATCVNLLQLRLTSLSDESWMAISTVDSGFFEKIKTDQSLHVTYQEFVDHLINILDSCRKGELCISLEKSDHSSFKLTIFERRSFRNLIHLSLPIDKAPLETVLYHINERNSVLQRQLSGVNDQMSVLKEEISRKDELQRRLQAEVAHVPQKVEEERRKINQEKAAEIEDFKKVIMQLQTEKVCEEKRMQDVNLAHLEKLKQLKSENFHLKQSVTDHSAKADTLTMELSELKVQHRRLAEENAKLHEAANEVTCKSRKQELGVMDLKKQLKDQREKVMCCEKQISELMAELEAEKSLCRTKRNSLQIATEENSKANSIILKLKKKNDTLTEKLIASRETAAKQERMIEEKSREMTKYAEILKSMEVKMKECAENGREITSTMDNLHDAVDAIEEKYTQKLGEISSRLLGTKLPDKRPSVLLQRNRI
ncbi:spindle assembly abnormal protein 6 homolog [Phlebotomus argentipes]|uniref:spindle assembly abnormal protein 6 homolog n=1 Tax=Phlebotomus argentipes TaxID=94469 RepID=UPI00289380FF|nr:spindle assembly abnormal protein 6 homolog [Phlebotomus argentipes]